MNGTADVTTRFVVQAPASLFNHDGAGHQLKLNKAAAGETASLLFQDGYSGRAEIGLAGDDDLHCKVSADGSAWAEALTVERSTGEVSLPATPWASGGNLLLNGDLELTQEDFEPEARQLDGTLHHAIERCFTISAWADGFLVRDTKGKVLRPHADL